MKRAARSFTELPGLRNRLAQNFAAGLFGSPLEADQRVLPMASRNPSRTSVAIDALPSSPNRARRVIGVVKRFKPRRGRWWKWHSFRSSRAGRPVRLVLMEGLSAVKPIHGLHYRRRRCRNAPHERRGALTPEPSVYL